VDRYNKIRCLAGLLMGTLEPVISQLPGKPANLEFANQGAETPLPTGAHYEIPIEVNRDFGTILIRARVNGRPATLVMDTGSSHTILSSELLDVRPLVLDQASSPGKGSGFVGRAAWAKTNVEVGIRGWKDRRVLVMNDFREISNTMKQKVDGILGEDLLEEFEFVVIDYKYHRLILSQ
jgi:hypothetical protein